MAVPLFKIPLIIASAIVSHFAGTDPNPTPKDVEAKKYASGDLSSKVVCWIPGLMKVRIPYPTGVILVLKIESADCILGHDNNGDHGDPLYELPVTPHLTTRTLIIFRHE
jgi:hypothetical protein